MAIDKQSEASPESSEAVFKLAQELIAIERYEEAIGKCLEILRIE